MSPVSVRRRGAFFHPLVEIVKDCALRVLDILGSAPVQRRGRSIQASFRPCLEDLEARTVLSFADGNGAVVTNLAVQNDGTQLVITFDGPLNADPTNPVQSPTNAGNFSVQIPAVNPEVVTSSMSTTAITSATYNNSSFQVSLNLGSALVPGSFYRVFINGTASADGTAQPGLVDTNGNPIDGDYDDTASGNFYALFAWTTAGTPLVFSDSGGDQVTLTISGPGQLDAWRALDGDFVANNLAVQSGLAIGAIQQLTVANGVLGETTLSGSANFATGNSVVVVPSLAGQGITFTNALPPYFQLTPPPAAASPTPVVATSSNLPYSLQIQPITATLPAVQAPVDAQDNVAGSPFDGYWLLFGGRTNGLHNFNPTDDFPPQEQNEDIFVINPATWQTWTVAWSATDVPTAMLPPLYSTNQQSFQEGDTLYAVGGYGAPDQGGGNFGTYTTYSTLTALSVDGLITAVVNGGDVVALARIQQIQDARLEVTGGEMQMFGNLAYLVVGQDFQGEYFSPTATQTYTDEIQSFQITYNGQVPDSLGISNYQAQNDQVNFRRRDYNLGTIIQSGLQPGLEIFGGVFTPGAATDASGGLGYRNPIVVSGIGATQVSQYQQFFNQYSAPNIGLFSASANSMYTVFLGGISLYDYNFSTGQLTEDTELPFVDDVTTLVQGAGGVSQEYEMPSQLPGLYGASATFFATPGLPEYANGVIQLDQIDQLSQSTTLGYMFGGILSTVPNTTDPGTQTSATDALFRVVLVPSPQPVSGLVYYDFSGSGTPTPGDPGLPGKTVYLDLNHDDTLDPGDPTAVTTSNGTFTFANVSPGTYTVRQAVAGTNILVTGAAANGIVIDVAGAGVTGVNFGDVLFNPAAPVEVNVNIFGTSNPDADTAYIQGLYHALLGRAAAPAEVQNWMAALTQQTREQVAFDIVASPEHRGLEVDSYYALYLDRVESPAERNGWIDAFLAGASETDVAAAFLNSPEYQAAHATDALFAEGLYIDILGRTGSSTELAAVESELAAGTTRAALIAGYLHSTEAYQLAVESFYAAYLHRDGSLDSGFASWVDLLQSGQTLGQVQAEILGSDEFFNDGAATVS